MTVPLSIQEQLRQSYFMPTHMIAILVGISRSDEVWLTDGDGEPAGQAVPDNPHADQDCVQMRDFLLKFGLPEENIHYLQDPSEHAANCAYMDLLEQLTAGRRADPPEDYLVVHCFSASAIQVNGMQSLLLNEYDEESSFYRLFEAEDLLRGLADEFSNLYQIGIFTSHRKQAPVPRCARRPNARASDVHTRKKSADRKAGEKAKHTLRKMLDAAGAPEEIQTNRESMISSMLPARQPRRNLILMSAQTEYMPEQGGAGLIKDLVNLLIKRLDRQTLSVQFPDVVNQLGPDENLEVSASNSISPLKLFYSHNIATHTIAMVLVNTHTRGLAWDKAAWKGKGVEQLFKEIFAFQQVQVHTDLTKREMIEEFDRLQRTVDKFEANRRPWETLCVAVVWIGHTLYLNSHHNGMIQPKDGPPRECEDRTLLPQQFGLSKYGEPISVYEYCSRLCKGEHTHLLHVSDWNPVHLGQLLCKHVDQSREFYELKLADHRGWWRFSCVTYGIKEFCQYFANCRRQRDQKVF